MFFHFPYKIAIIRMQFNAGTYSLQPSCPYLEMHFFFLFSFSSLFYTDLSSIEVKRITMEGIRLVSLNINPKILLEFVWFVVQWML